MKNGEFQESVTDIVLEPIKAIPKKVIENIRDKSNLKKCLLMPEDGLPIMKEMKQKNQN